MPSCAALEAVLFAREPVSDATPSCAAALDDTVLFARDAVVVSRMLETESWPPLEAGAGVKEGASMMQIKIYKYTFERASAALFLRGLLANNIVLNHCSYRSYILLTYSGL